MHWVRWETCASPRQASAQEMQICAQSKHSSTQRISASLALTGDRSPCDVFITAKSLVWGRDARSPISRVPLASIRDVTPGKSGSRSGQAAAFVGLGDGSHDRVEFPFVFDAYGTDDRNALERSAFVVHLRSRPVALAYPGSPYRPWLPPVPNAFPMPSQNRMPTVSHARL